MTPLDGSVATAPEGLTETLAGVLQGTWLPLIYTYMKIFRLDVLGDFDIFEIQGLDNVVVADKNLTAGEVVGRIDEPTVNQDDPEAKWHIGIRTFVVINVIVIHVMILNMYIGLLSSIYDDKAKHRRQLLWEFRTMFSWKFLVAKSVLRPVWTRICWWRHSDEEHASPKSIWIAYNPRTFADETDDSAQLEQLRNNLRSLQQVFNTVTQTRDLEVRAPEFY